MSVFLEPNIAVNRHVGAEAAARPVRRTHGNVRGVQEYVRHKDVQTTTVYTKITQHDLEQQLRVGITGVAPTGFELCDVGWAEDSGSATDLGLRVNWAVDPSRHGTLAPRPGPL